MHINIYSMHIYIYKRESVCVWYFKSSPYLHTYIKSNRFQIHIKVYTHTLKKHKHAKHSKNKGTYTSHIMKRVTLHMYTYRYIFWCILKYECSTNTPMFAPREKEIIWNTQSKGKTGRAYVWERNPPTHVRTHSQTRSSTQATWAKKGPRIRRMEASRACFL